MKNILGGAVTAVVGVLAVLLVGFLFWAGIRLPLNVRFPVPSPDGRYLAYCDPSPDRRDDPASRDETSDTLVIASRSYGRARTIWLLSAPSVTSPLCCRISAVNS